MKRVVVTGLGLISSLGIGLEESWKKLIAGETEYGYPPTRYRTMHPDEVDPSDFAKMSDKEFNDYLVALDIVLDYRAIPQGRSIITALTN